MKDFLDDIESLSKGKGTRRKIGSRAIGHRLTPDERHVLKKALRQGYLQAVAVRKNVINQYEQICKELGLKMIVVDENLEAEIWDKDDYFKRSFASQEELDDFASDNVPDRIPFGKLD